AGALAAICLLLIYGGLIYLGATSGIEETTIKRSELLIYISHTTLGRYGTVAIAIGIALACLTTAIALTCAVGTFFNNLANGKLSYELLVALSCLVSALLSITGVDTIIHFAYPPFAANYPIVITALFHVVFVGRGVKSNRPYIAAQVASTSDAFFNV